MAGESLSINTTKQRIGRLRPVVNSKNNQTHRPTRNDEEEGTMKTQFRSDMWLVVVALILWVGIAVAESDHRHNGDQQRSTAEDFLALEVRPIAIGHHGVGPNRGENPSLP